MLGLVNGLMLLKFYLRDKAKLTARTVHPDTYQWWFTMPAGKFEGNPTRRYGFIAYVEIQNSGLRKTQLTSWRLFIKTRLGGSHELQPINMPEPSAAIGDHIKRYPVLGQRGLHFEGDTLVDSGCSISGMVYYLYECYGTEGWDPSATSKEIQGWFEVSDGFNRKAKCKLRFSQRSLETIKAFAPCALPTDDC